jgi:hypothetical protein
MDKRNNSLIEYDSMRAAARSLGVNPSTLAYYVNKNKLLKDIYLITKL